MRKRFCVSFDFELQAAADDDTVLISLGPQHSFPLTDVPGMVSSTKAKDVLTQAVLPHPMLQSRWRWNLNRALIVPRSRNGKRRPIHLQRMEADDLLAAAWPALAACQENADAGPVAVPDHVLVRQTVADCLTGGAWTPTAWSPCCGRLKTGPSVCTWWSRPSRPCWRTGS